jgi:hypothetical protein
MHIGSLDDDDPPGPRGRDRLCHLWPLIAGIGEDRFDEWEAPPRLTQNIARAVAILQAVGMNDDAQQKPERVDEDMAFAAGDFLARIISLRVQSRAPF